MPRRLLVCIQVLLLFCIESAFGLVRSLSPHSLNFSQVSGLGNTTAFVVRTRSTPSPWLLYVVQRYQEQLAPHGIQVAVLRDISDSSEDDGTVHSTSLDLEEGSSVPLCEVSWNAAKRVFGEDLLNKYSQVGGGGKVVGIGTNTVYDVLWWRHCAPTLSSSKLRHVWMSEDDAFFNGKVDRFVNTYAGESADLIAAGFRIAGSHWWQYAAFNESLSLGLKTFARRDRVVQNVPLLPTLSHTSCSDESSDNVGLIFRQAHVERLSSRLFNMLDHAVSNKILGPAEAFVSTVCASRVGLGAGETCSMLDFAPLFSRFSGLTWASPKYCWIGNYMEMGEQCKFRFRDKWIHPVRQRTDPRQIEAC